MKVGDIAVIRPSAKTFNYGEIINWQANQTPLDIIEEDHDGSFLLSDGEDEMWLDPEEIMEVLP